MLRYSARLLIVVVPLLAWIAAADTPVSAVGTTPILLVANDAAPNPYGAYLGEILRAEGLNAFTTAQLATLDAATLSAADLVVLAETPLTAAQAALFGDYVGGGGRLIAMRPDADLAPLLDLAPAGAALADPYLGINTALTVGQGLPSATLQIHGAADRYNQAGGTTIAALYSNASSATAHPAVTVDNTGRAAAWTYDLARNIVLTRQGNPANANLDVDVDGVLRTIDLFQGSGGGAPWVNRDRIPVPQADVQQRLFARVVRQLLEGIVPLPQLWYFPGDEKTMLILTGDAHANPPDWFERTINSINARNGKITLYLAIGGFPTNTPAQAWRAQGHEIGIHPPRNSPPGETFYVCATLAACYDTYDTWWNNQGFTSQYSRTVRNHQVTWVGWTDAAEIEAANGMALDTNFYHWGAWIQKPDTSWPMGYIIGSGQPMKFVRDDGTVLPLYQQLTQLVDEQLTSDSSFQNLTGAQAAAISQQLINASLAGDYAAIMTQFHVDYYYDRSQTWAELTMDYANSVGVPMWNADRWLAFTETRHDAEFTALAWDGPSGQLTFRLSAPANGEPLSILLPGSFGGAAFGGAQVDGAAATHTLFTVSGRQYALITVPAGEAAITAGYGVPPGPPTPTSTPTNTPTSTPTPTVTSTMTPPPPSTPGSTRRVMLPFAAR